MDADYAFSFATIMPALAIHTVQGANHLSPYAGQTVRVLGIVTARDVERLLDAGSESRRRRRALGGHLRLH
jgi:hypothetical protein